MSTRFTKRARPVGGDGRVILAIDGGGSRTRCVAADETGRVLGTSVAGPSNVVQCPPSIVKLNVEAVMAGAVVEAGSRRDRVTAVGAGHAGVLPDGKNGKFVVRFLKEFCGDVPIVVTGDNVIALRGAIPEGAGVVAIAGTGSSVFGKSANGAWVKVGGGGPLLGDEGSGHQIALAGLRAAWRAHDGRGRPTALVEGLSRALGVARLEDAVDKLYGSDMSREAVAALASVVAEAGAAGDEAALDILRGAGHELGLAAATAVARLGMSAGCVVSHGGAVFEWGGTLSAAFSDTLRSACPGAVVRPPALPPVGGAFLMALDALQLPATEDVLDHFRRGSGCGAAAEPPVEPS